MILISHRGNVNGPLLKRENTRSYIQEAINLGYDVEIDVWRTYGDLWLGHDYPKDEVDIIWLLNRRDNLWVHCKNLEALTKLIDTKLRVFYHKEDEYVLMDGGYIWSKNSINVNNKCIVPLLSKDQLNRWPKKEVHGICSDYISLFNET
ncbi:MAG: hypothetical protein H8E98_05635 [Bacteroidetes bacterium]|nr:hypothetical protein [Bacteroidota bacterium]